jgi:hypothetical protein
LSSLRRNSSTSIAVEWWIMSPVEIAIIVLILPFLASFPIWPYSRRWGYGVSGVLGAMILLLVAAWMIL